MVKFRDVKRAMDGPLGPQTLDLIIEVETDEGNVEEWPFHYVPDDTWPVTLAVKEWLAEHADFPIAKRPPPTVEDFNMNRANLRRVLVAVGQRADAVETALDKNPGNEMLRVEWLEAVGGWPRTAPLVKLVLDHYGIDPKAFDAEWLRRGKEEWGLP